MAKQRKKFKDSKIGAFLKDKAPDLLDSVGDFLPDQGALGIVKNIISKDDSISETDKAAIIQELNYELEQQKIEAADRESARNREIEIAKAGGSDPIQKSVAFTLLAMLILCVVTVLFVDLKNENLAHLIIGEILGFFSGLVVYYFGSSKGSKDKTNSLNQLLNKLK